MISRVFMRLEATSQGVAGSNPVSPTSEGACQSEFARARPFFRALSISQHTEVFSPGSSCVGGDHEG